MEQDASWPNFGAPQPRPASEFSDSNEEGGMAEVRVEVAITEKGLKLKRPSSKLEETKEIVAKRPACKNAEKTPAEPKVKAKAKDKTKNPKVMKSMKKEKGGKAACGSKDVPKGSPKKGSNGEDGGDGGPPGPRSSPSKPKTGCSKCRYSRNGCGACRAKLGL